MRIFNLPRASGKTTRLVYMSEAQNIPILCCSQCDKKILQERANIYGLKIPEPILIDELRGRDVNEILIDEGMVTLQKLINVMACHSVKIKAVTMTVDETIMN